MNPTLNMSAAWTELERSIRAALETYSNVHRGSGHFSLVTTQLFERARERILDVVGASSAHTVVFCTPRRAERLEPQLGAGLLRCLSSEEIGLPLGVRALVTRRAALPRGIPGETGGGTARLVGRDWVVWTKLPDRLEAGTPPIVNVIAFAQALQLTKRFEIARFAPVPRDLASADDILHKDELDALSGQELLAALRRAHIGRDVLVPTRRGTLPFVNLDHAASTPTFEPIWQAFVGALAQPVSAQPELVREVKSICARALGAPSASYDLFFTSNTTEAINLVARSLANESVPGGEPVVLNTLLEHNSNELPWRTVAGHELIRLPVDEEGFIDLPMLAGLLRAYNRNGEHGKKRIRLVAVSGASNVLGSFNDLAQIGRVAHAHGARVLVDAAQLVAHRPVDMEGCGIDYLAFSAHKMYAPFGAGALVAKKGLLGFDAQELASITASGEANLAGIVAMGKAFVILQRIGMDVIQQEEQALTAYALERLSEVPALRIFGVKSRLSAGFARKGGVIALMPGKSMPSGVARKLAENGAVGVRYGCHCSHLLVKRLHGISPLLERFQWALVNLLPSLQLPGVLRVSLGLESNREDIDRLVATLVDVARDSEGGLSRREFRQQLDAFMQTAMRSVYSSSSTS